MTSAVLGGVTIAAPNMPAKESPMWYPTDHILGLQRNGVNHVGMETPFRGRPQGYTAPVRATTYPVTSATLLQRYSGSGVGELGMRSARVLVSWESLQKNPDPLPRPFVAAAMGAIPSNVGGFVDYWTDLTKLIIGLIDRGIYVIVGPWQYNKNAINGNGDTDITYNDQSFDKEHFADFWGKFATAINQAVAAGFPPDPAFPANASRRDKLAFDLINEPHEPRPTDGTVGITVANWVGYAQAAIDSIRNNPANTNTVFVEGMGYGSTKRDAHRLNPANPASQLLWELLNDPLKRIAISAHCYAGTVVLPGEAPSPKPTDAMRTACTDLVVWARQKGFKVHIGEVALDAGVSGCSDLATATAQWEDWTQYCLENDDVLVGWDWWANTSSTWGWPLEGSCSGSRNWALTQNDGATWSTYVGLIDDSIPVPELVIRDNLADAGAEPNLTTTVAWESPDIWVRKTADNMVGDETILGGTGCVVYVRVTNRGDRDYPAAGNDVVALYWAKASTALSIPEPWNGKVGGVVPTPIPGGLVGSASVGFLQKKTSKMIPIVWATTPNPADYPVKDGHFCLLAVITKSFNQLALVEHEGLEAPLSPSVLKMNNVAWHNIHIASAAPFISGGRMRLGAAVLANPTGKPMRASLRLEMLDTRARPIDPRRGSLRITLEGAALEKLRRLEVDRPLWEDVGDGSFAVLDPAAAMPDLMLESGEILPVELSSAADRRDKGYAVRAMQYERDGAFRRLVGGQTFVIGEVDGFTARRRRVDKNAIWPWLVASGTLLILVGSFGRHTKPRR